MVQTRSFKETLLAHLANSPAYAEAHLATAIDALLDGDHDSGLSMLRDYVNGTVGFKRLAGETGFGEKSLMRMLSATGNPRSRNLFKIIATLQRLSNRHLSVAAE